MAREGRAQAELISTRKIGRLRTLEELVVNSGRLSFCRQDWEKAGGSILVYSARTIGIYANTVGIEGIHGTSVRGQLLLVIFLVLIHDCNA